MHIFSFVRDAARRDVWWMLALTVIAGFSNALLVVVVNSVAGQVAQGHGLSVWWGVSFIVAFVIYYESDRFAMLRANTMIERLLKRLRTDIVDKLRQSELPVVDRVGRGELISLLSQETNHLSVTFPILVDSFQQAVLLAVSLIYLAYLSTAALVVFLVGVAAGIAGYVQIGKSFKETLKDVAHAQARMVDAIGDIIDGAKELRLNTRKSDSVYAAFRDVSRSAEESLNESGEHWASMIMLTAFVTYFMLGVVVFIFPRYLPRDIRSLAIFRLVPVLLFCLGALSRIVARSPMFVRADAGLGAIQTIERRFDKAAGISTAQARALSHKFRKFERITYRGISFSHRDATGTPVFTSGPWDLTLHRGEILFLVGGNGSGKSTALRLITGLYPAETGQVEVNGAPVRGAEMAGLREQFSAIFGDFHLFDRLYGAEKVDAAEVNRLIAEMGLANKVNYVDGRFTDLNLSTGQRKRLALVAALVEDRPIYVFDEWSAEQDAHFREEFYRRLLPSLKMKGKTVVAVTHDERFWHLADRVVKLDLGSVVWERASSELETKT